MIIRSILTLICGLAAIPTWADVTGPGGKTIDCYCTDQGGSRIELGESICLQVDGRMFTAQCQMSLNVPMWRKVEDGCLTARRMPLESGDPTVDAGLVHPQI